MKFGRRSIAFWLVSNLVSPPCFSGSKPIVIVPPLGGRGNEPARLALARELKESDQVTVVNLEMVDRYLSNKRGASSEKKVPPSVLKDLDRGQKFYRDLKMKDAIAALTKAKIGFRDHLIDRESFTGLRASQFHLAMVYLATGEKNKAKEELREAIGLDTERRTRKLSAKLYPPNVIRLYEEVRAQVAKEKQGDLEVISNPPGVMAYVDGKGVGTTPASLLGIPKGEHYLHLQGDNLEPYFGLKFVVEGDNRISIDLKPASMFDPISFFMPLEKTSQMDHKRAAFLDEAGLALAADIFVFVQPETGAVQAQLYDQRSQELSSIERDTTPAGLATKLLRHLDGNGYVSSEVAKPEEPQVAEPKEIPPAFEPKTTKTLTEQAQQPLSVPNQPGDSKLWYENKWLWGGLGGAALLTLGSLFLFTDVFKGDPTTSRITVTFP